MSRTTLTPTTIIESPLVSRPDLEFEDHGRPYYDPEIADEMALQMGDGQANDLSLHCFQCNRQESFFSALRGSWMYSYFVGFTFGLASLLGPFKCRCCGHSRLIRSDVWHPHRWLGR